MTRGVRQGPEGPRGRRLGCVAVGGKTNESGIYCILSPLRPKSTPPSYLAPRRAPSRRRRAAGVRPRLAAEPPRQIWAMTPPWTQGRAWANRSAFHQGDDVPVTALDSHEGSGVEEKGHATPRCDLAGADRMTVARERAWRTLVRSQPR